MFVTVVVVLVCTPRKGFLSQHPLGASRTICLHVLNPSGPHLEWELVLPHLTNKKTEAERMTCWYMAVLGFEPGSCS